MICAREVNSPSLTNERRARYWLALLANLAERTGLEPATSDVTGRRSNQLNYRSAITCPLILPFETPPPARRDRVSPKDLLVGGTGLEPMTPGL